MHVGYYSPCKTTSFRRFYCSNTRILSGSGRVTGRRRGSSVSGNGSIAGRNRVARARLMVSEHVSEECQIAAEDWFRHFVEQVACTGTVEVATRFVRASFRGLPMVSGVSRSRISSSTWCARGVSGDLDRDPDMLGVLPGDAREWLGHCRWCPRMIRSVPMDLGSRIADRGGWSGRRVGSADIGLMGFRVLGWAVSWASDFLYFIFILIKLIYFN
jgi:hypothetical protein